ncbi:MAG: chromate efflux transporter [Candidatus Dormiibacterota bacterium]
MGELDVRPRRRAIPAALEVLLVATRLGLTSFGGPVAHLGYFRDEYVRRRQWLDERTYADLVALCQLLPGPASSELGIAVGILRARLLGGLMAWLGFTMPSAIAMTAFAAIVRVLGGSGDLTWLHGLQVVAVVVVAQAVWSMAHTLTPDRTRLLLALVAAGIATVLPAGAGQVIAILLGGVAGAVLLREAPGTDAGERLPMSLPVGRRLGGVVLVVFLALLLALPIARQIVSDRPLAVFESFYVVASFVFGGGHVVLPLLQAQVVPNGWLTNAQFLAGYGAAQAMPGPLFTFGAYLGAMALPGGGGIAGAAIGLVAIFAPSFFLVIGILPYWDALRRRSGFQSVLRGVNAAVVGVLLAALYNPVWVTAVRQPSDFLLLLVGFTLLFVLRAPPWVVVLAVGALGAGLHGLALVG